MRIKRMQLTDRGSVRMRRGSLGFAQARVLGRLASSSMLVSTSTGLAAADAPVR